MPNRRYQLMAIDVDGTLVGQGMEPTPRVAEAVRSAARAGVCVSLASGRAFPSMLHHASSLGLVAPVICYQGAEIRDPVDGAILYRAALPRRLAEEAVRVAGRMGLEPTVHCNDTIYLSGPRRDQAFYDWAFGLPVTDVPDLGDVSAGDPMKVLIIGEPGELDVLEPDFRARFQGRAQVVRSHRLFLETVATDVSKGDALSRVAGLLGAGPETTVAVGDQQNDISMIRWAGLGVAMGNAPAEVKAAADLVAPSLEEDGVAWVIDRFVLCRQG